jgi:hypothetical protein
MDAAAKLTICRFGATMSDRWHAAAFFSLYTSVHTCLLARPAISSLKTWAILGIWTI